MSQNRASKKYGQKVSWGILEDAMRSALDRRVGGAEGGDGAEGSDRRVTGGGAADGGGPRAPAEEGGGRPAWRHPTGGGPDALDGERGLGVTSVGLGFMRSDFDNGSRTSGNIKDSYA